MASTVTSAQHFGHASVVRSSKPAAGPYFSPKRTFQKAATRASVRARVAEIPDTEGLPEIFVIEDEDIAAKAAEFPLSTEDLIARTKVFLRANNGAKRPEMVAEDFEFCAPVVGPLSKDFFLDTISQVDIQAAMPDFKENMYDFRADPFVPGRIWFTAAPTGTHTGADLLGFKAEGGRWESAPQANSVTFNEEGLVKEYTIGYVMDRRIGNSGGLGGIYGLLYAIGKPLPFPEANPWKMSKRYWLFNKLGGFLRSLQKK